MPERPRCCTVGSSRSSSCALSRRASTYMLTNHRGLAAVTSAVQPYCTLMSCNPVQSFVGIAEESTCRVYLPKSLVHRLEHRMVAHAAVRGSVRESQIRQIRGHPRGARLRELLWCSMAGVRLTLTRSRFGCRLHGRVTATPVAAIESPLLGRRP